MARKTKSKVSVEMSLKDGSWIEWKTGFATMQDAEDWVIDNICDNHILRVVRISGVFNAKRTVIKR